MCWCSDCFCCICYTRVHSFLWLCILLSCGLLVHKLNTTGLASARPSLWMHLSHLLYWSSCPGHWTVGVFQPCFFISCCLVDFHLGEQGEQVFTLLLSWAICVSFCWTSSRVLVLCCSLLLKFTVWCGHSVLWPVLFLALLVLLVGPWFVLVAVVLQFLLVLSSGMSEPS